MKKSRRPVTKVKNPMNFEKIFNVKIDGSDIIILDSPI